MVNTDYNPFEIWYRGIKYHRYQYHALYIRRDDTDTINTNDTGMIPKMILEMILGRRVLFLYLQVNRYNTGLFKSMDRQYFSLDMLLIE